MGLVNGVGIYEKGKYTARLEGKRTKEYELWCSMLKRCYTERELLKFPTYRGCSVSSNFLNYQYFAGWCNGQKDFGLKGWQLDKDILIKDNKIYSENTCCFVPVELNLIIVSSKINRGLCPIGVSYHKKSKVFHARYQIKGKKVHVGTFKDSGDAFQAYKSAKEAYMQKAVVKFKDLLEHKVYNAILNYKIQLTD